MSQALLVIDVQNEYFSDGKVPLWNVEATTDSIVGAIKAAQSKQIPVILVKHILPGEEAPFFAEGTTGSEIHDKIRAAAPDSTVIVKHHADSFLNTNLTEMLTGLNVRNLLVSGMMTQCCVTHTSISKAAENFDITVLSDCCTAVSEVVHVLAMIALSDRVKTVSANEVL